MWVERKDRNEMDILAIAISILGIVIGMLILKRAEERTQSQDVAYRLMERLKRYATYRPHSPSP